MAEYIEREAIIKQLCLTTACSYYGEDVRTIIGFPAADVQPVKHGRWIDIYEWAEMHDSRPSGMCTYYWCSECEKEQESKSNFCPYCGARMDGDSE